MIRASDILRHHGVLAAAEPVKTASSMDVFLDLVDRVEHHGLHQVQFQGHIVHLSPCPDVNMTMGNASLTGLALQADGLPRARIAFRGSVKKPEHRAIYIMVTGGITDLLKDLNGLDAKQMLALILRTYLHHAVASTQAQAAAEPPLDHEQRTKQVFLALTDVVERAPKRVVYAGVTVHVDPAPDVHMFTNGIAGLELTSLSTTRARVTFRTSRDSYGIYIIFTDGTTAALQNLHGLDVAAMLKLIVRTYMEHSAPRRRRLS